MKKIETTKVSIFGVALGAVFLLALLTTILATVIATASSEIVKKII